MSRANYVFLNRKIVPSDQARISVWDSGFQLGLGVFETLRSADGKIFFLAEHLNELKRNLKRLRIKPPKLDVAIVEKNIRALLQKNNLSLARIRLTVTPQTFLITAQPLVLKKTAAKVATVRLERSMPQIKSLNYVISALAGEEACRRGCQEALLVNREGFVTEGARSNVFLVKGGKVFTPPEDCLRQGITRKKILELCRELKIPLQEKKLRPADLQKAEEVFLTNALVEIWSVSHINGKKISGGAPGKVTKVLIEGFKKKCEM